MKYKCIIFDCDGVLVDSERTTISVIVDMAKRVGFDMDLEEAIQEFSGQSIQYCFEYINARSTALLTDAAIPEFRQRTFQAYKKDLKAIPGIRELLMRLKGPRCVASNAPISKIELNLGILKLTDFFDGNLFSAYQVQKWKPEPDLFLFAADKMGFKPSECAVIEDSLAGVQAAKAGGFDVFGYASQRTEEKLAAAGATVFYDMNRLDDLLNAQ